MIFKNSWSPNGSNLPLWWWLSSSTPLHHFSWRLRDFTATILHWSSLQALVFTYGTWKWTGVSWHRQITEHQRRAKTPISAPAGRARAWWRQEQGSPAVRLQLPWEGLRAFLWCSAQEPELRNVLQVMCRKERRDESKLGSSSRTRSGLGGGCTSTRAEVNKQTRAGIIGSAGIGVVQRAQQSCETEEYC